MELTVNFCSNRLFQNQNIIVKIWTQCASDSDRKSAFGYLFDTIFITALIYQQSAQNGLRAKTSNKFEREEVATPRRTCVMEGVRLASRVRVLVCVILTFHFCAEWSLTGSINTSNLSPSIFASR